MYIRVQIQYHNLTRNKIDWMAGIARYWMVRSTIIYDSSINTESFLHLMMKCIQNLSDLP